MKVLNIGTPKEDSSQPPGENWMTVNCDTCGCEMYLRKKSMDQPEGAEIVLCCMRCLIAMTPSLKNACGNYR